jgi:carbonic anhydrase
MTRMTPLLERNQQFASTYTPGPLAEPTAQMVIVTCLDHRVDPAITLGLRLGDAPVIRNAGGRVTQAVIDDIAYLAYLAEQLFGAKTRTAGCSRSRSSTTPNAEPAFSPTPASGTRPPKRPACPRQHWKPPPSPTRTSPSRPTSSGCSPRPCSHRR